MTTIKFGDVEYRIKYGYEATMRSDVLKTLASVSGEGNSLDKIEMMADLIPELLLVGLQKYHREEFGFDYKTGEGKDKQIDKIYGLLDDYFDGDDADFMELANKLQSELMENGFLARMLRQSQDQSEGKRSKKITEISGN